MTYTLINAGPSPYGRKVAVALREKNIEFETILDLPWAEAVETKRYSPLEQLPILIPPEGKPVFDSSLILQWLELRHPDPPLLPDATDARILALEVQTLGERLMEIVQSLVFEMFRDVKSRALVDRLTAKIGSGLRYAEQLLTAQIPSPVETIHYGHIALATALSCWEFIVSEGMSPQIEVLLWRNRYERLTLLVELMEKRSSFAATRPQSMAVDIAGQMS